VLAEVPVLDERIERLGELFPTAKRTYATVRVRELPVTLTEQGALSPAVLVQMRAVDALAIVVRAFADPAVAHPLGLSGPDPARDLQRILDGLVFSDFAVVEARLERLAKEGSRGSAEYRALQGLSERLGEGQLITPGGLANGNAGLLSGFAFLTAKPIVVVLNTGQSSVDTGAAERRVADLGLDLFLIQGRQEMEIALLPPEDQREFLADLGVGEAARDRFLRQVYGSLDLISFLTAGDKDVRAWSINSGATALKAAGRIHTDLARGFIRAEVVPYAELMASGGFAQAKKSGKLRLEGKDYVVADGDVLTIRFNV
jgi:ribosome-binding ATPase YchF (GTP1/OBG family)